MTKFMTIISKGKEIVQNASGLRIDGVSKSQNSTENTPSKMNNNGSSDSESENHNVSPTTKTVGSSETSCLTISVYSAVIIALVCTFLVVGRDYIKYVLISMEEREIWVSFAIFTCLFTIVSFPMTWGYILFNIAAGYLYGFQMGVITVMICALTGLSIAHLVIKTFLRNLVIKKFSNDTVKAIMRVIESGHGFRVVILSRLTPIPFGLQNAIFGISNISYSRYILASALGMAPSQGMHAYIGSTLRSMEEVMAGGSSKSSTAYLVFIGQLLMVIVLLVYIIRRARAEFDKTVQELDNKNSDSLDLSEKGELLHKGELEPYHDEPNKSAN